ncbi:uncharacterized protein LAESUDRAFT_729809 [Laetiporus sulphureus 93-53]|uniref:Uncharacterized protein n=1 Tax=Laetiporus sulphureus 93-53 TaxID=1314785 RepID=A0A165CHR5_9APHY|nr:uncharacterized protein LAESUDRAFT_729809 [Laetiporus sulphureus 93-53]KZT02839.1 hypothetical protein LAESUDRAFT_729809 [Laetiporus sulphureus 93-53]
MVRSLVLSSQLPLSTCFVDRVRARKTGPEYGNAGEYLYDFAPFRTRPLRFQVPPCDVFQPSLGAFPKGHQKNSNRLVAREPPI